MTSMISTCRHLYLFGLSSYTTPRLVPVDLLGVRLDYRRRPASVLDVLTSLPLLSDSLWRIKVPGFEDVLAAIGMKAHSEASIQCPTDKNHNPDVKQLTQA